LNDPTLDDSEPTPLREPGYPDTNPPQPPPDHYDTNTNDTNEQWSTPMLNLVDSMRISWQHVDVRPMSVAGMYTIVMATFDPTSSRPGVIGTTYSQVYIYKPDGTTTSSGIQSSPGDTMPHIFGHT